MVTEKKYEKFFDRLAVSGGMFFLNIIIPIFHNTPGSGKK